MDRVKTSRPVVLSAMQHSADLTIERESKKARLLVGLDSLLFFISRIRFVFTKRNSFWMIWSICSKHYK
jgi:hypothetical protein